MANYFIADLHFGHKNILSYDNRPFKSVESQDEMIIANWNSEITDDDDVWILGDISWYGAEKTCEIFKRLKGRKHLCKGNHDSKLLKNPEVRKLFVEICDYKELQLENGLGVVLCHYPIPCFKNHFYGWIHLYGHVHNSFEWHMMERIKREMVDLYTVKCLMFNVGCMMDYMNFTPRRIDQIVGTAEEFTLI